ncbi:sigma factor-like helix-turn-helix DNA-binding protein [Kitasatospora sp. NPDC006697]|uniref:sigma factor-like helix-turn-helix DNA-binding protein n=1 Tax=Kitasatospora sp. NPDC006697 TaxID=3364020 RepID=UPI0036C6A605
MRQESGPAAVTLSTAFDAVHAACAPELRQQLYLLTGSRRRADRAVRRAFGAAWPRWRALTGAGDDPAAWLRARACEHALAPWRPRRPRLTLRRTVPVPGPEDPAGRDRALLAALARLSGPRRRAVLLHDALGLTPAEIAAEVESSTAAATARVAAGRAELARLVPALVGADPAAPEFGERLGGLLYRAAERACPAGRPTAATRRLRAGGLLRTAAGPAACALLVLAAAGAIGGELTGHPLVPLPPCTTGCGEQSAPGH